MKQRREYLSTQNNRLSTVIRRYFNAGFSALLQTSTTISLIFKRRNSAFITGFILITLLSLSLSLFTGATNLFGLNGSANATTSTITLSITEGLSVDVMPSDNGTFASSTATNNVRVKTDSASGYELGIKASTSGSNNNALINTTDSSKIIPSITTSISESDYSSSSTYNNTWGFKPSKLNSQANSNYIPGPTDTINSIVLDRTTSSNPTTFNDYTITLGTRIDNTQAPGSYANTFVITAFVNPTPYSITYNKNTTDTVTNMPANVSSDTFSDQVTISNQVPARTDYYFKGWCTVQVADGGICTGTTYNPDGSGTNLTWTLDQTQSSNSLNLYAMWTKRPIYDVVASMSKGTQTLAELRADITTDNSGVYEYNSSVFGTASDAANTSKIYYYRGILDNTVGTYGSDGDNAAWPNTVVLSSASSKSGLTTNDTCWRIVRTTGSGGVKMIYQGKWTGSTCANSTTNAQVTTSAFNGTSSDNQQIVRIGYTHNSTYAVNTSQSGTIAQVFGSNSNPGANNTRSTIKEYIEDTWYANNMTSYTSKLEPSAGYCNDRTMNTATDWTTPLAESTTIFSTYGTSGKQVYYFGVYPRNVNTAQAPSLTCGNKYSQIDRSTVDLYRYVAGSTGVSNQLKYPAALLTADEIAFAGSGRSSSTTPYHDNSFLRSGVFFWALSPSSRSSNGNVGGFGLAAGGALSWTQVGTARGVRPAISLTSGTMAVSGTGTATDPWIVNP
ncbi:hypothetical protein IKD67_02335 [Candidatus Saccharibacteria bacterium]|nr:hypothetical protein [Candidatus Saccharibacteria bacterium]